MPNVDYAPQAKVDVLEVVRYTAVRSQSHQTCSMFLNALDERIKVLARHPNIGRARPDLGEAVRSLTFGNYIIFYVPTKNGIQLVRFLHGSRDIQASF